MPDTINNPVSEVFSRWSKDIQPTVGKGNFSMEKSQTIASGKTKYARLFILSFQTESYASGTKALSTAYEIDSKSHQAMVSMGFRRTYGPEEVANSEKSFKRIISRYSRIYTGQLLEV